MKTFSIIILCISIITFSRPSIAQVNVKISKQEFKITDNGFNQAWKNIRKGNKHYMENKRGSYRLAFDYYILANEYNADVAELNYKIGVSACKISNGKAALKHLQNAFKIKENVSSDIHFWLGYAYHLNSQFDKAKEEYTQFQSTLTPKQIKKFAYDIEKLIQECKNGAELIKKPTRVLIDNLGQIINSNYSDYAPVFIESDSILYFTSRRPDSYGKKRNPINNEYFEDIYSTHYKNGKWDTVYHFGKPLNTKGNDAAVAVSPDGKTLLIYRYDKSKGSIYESKYKKDYWTSLSKITGKINLRGSRETSMCFSRDSSRIYFVSDREGGFGGKDIWFVKKDSKGNWGKAENAGSQINSPYDEESPFIDYTDTVMYFCSKGHNTIGGFDIFKSKMGDNGQWKEPRNLGIPLNTPTDDMFFIISDNLRFGFYTSTSLEEYGDKDIFSVVFLGPEKEIKQDETVELISCIAKPVVSDLKMATTVDIKTMRLTVVKGKVYDYTTKQPLLAKIDITDNSVNKAFTGTRSDSINGTYQVMLPSGRNYGMSVAASGYMFHSENFLIPEGQNYTEVVKDISLLPINPGSRIVLNNTFFDTGKSTLKTESFTELDILAGYFNLYPKLRVEISGHTDNIGWADGNIKLSKERAQAVVDYLVNKGVPKDRLTAVGFGSNMPIASNNTEDGRKKNRRVEAKILSN